MPKPMTQDEFEKNFTLDNLPLIFHAAISQYGYNAYLKGFNQGFSQGEEGVKNTEEFQRQYPSLPKIVQNLLATYAYSAYINGYHQVREENRQ